MSTKKHSGHPHLTGEHRWGDTGQLILLVMFLGVWISDSFVFQYSTFLEEEIPNLVRVPLASLILLAGWYLARNGMKKVFGTPGKEPGVIHTGVFRIVRHPIYLGAILFYLGAAIISMSMASGAFILVIIAFYIAICKYEERALKEAFGNDYLEYKKKTGMLFPRLLKRSRD
ncbi:MAG: isoprenylcysteine carboxylmethyltransferase family protein [Bacteroidales bacterium]|nr:isoprenylcysteine carboxylmethyltransferase family protein [Bacteroidales bacterium]